MIGRRLDPPHDDTMHGMARPRVLFAGTLLLAGAVGGCARAPERVFDCMPPASEQTLLAQYECDPVLAAAPAGAIQRGEPSRAAACFRVGRPGREDISQTAVWVQYDLAGDLGPEDVRALVEPVAGRGGWELFDSQLNDFGGMLSYCRVVLGAPSVLVVTWQDAIGPGGDARPAEPGVLTMGMLAATNADLQRGDGECVA